MNAAPLGLALAELAELLREDNISGAQAFVVFCSGLIDNWELTTDNWELATDNWATDNWATDNWETDN
jgi:hypothetical protein